MPVIHYNSKGLFRLTVIFFSILISGSCASKKTQEAPAMKSIRIMFNPSFMFASELEIADGNNPGVNIKVTSRNESGSIKTVHAKTFNITDEELSVLIDGIESFKQGYSGPQTRFGADGISVFVISDQLQANDTLGFWSPRREGTDSIYYRLLDPVFDIMRKYMTVDAEMMYVEQLEQYFDYGAPIKKTGKNEYRIYGALSYFDHITKAINSLVDEIPADEPVLIDMSNFEGMGTIYYPHFKKLLARNNQVKWIVNDSSREQLLEIGWPESSLEQTTRKGFGEF